jgi:hypothetical protein
MKISRLFTEKEKEEEERKREKISPRQTILPTSYNFIFFKIFFFLLLLVIETSLKRTKAQFRYKGNIPKKK